MFDFELERRNLQSVTLNGGVLVLQGEEGFSDFIVDNHGERLVVFAADQTYFFDAEEIRVIQYTSSEEGEDLLINFTDEKVIAHLYGQNNTVLGVTVLVDHASNTIVEEF